MAVGEDNRVAMARCDAVELGVSGLPRLRLEERFQLNLSLYRKTPA